MKIVSPMGIVMAVLLTALVVGCSSGPGKAPDDGTPPDDMPATPSTWEFTGTFVAVPDANPLTGTITATITGVSQDGTAVDAAALAGVLAQLNLSGPMQTFSYTVVPSLQETSITLTGDLLTALMLPDGMVTATRPSPPDPTADPTAALDGTWTASTTDPESMATINLTVDITAPDFTLTVAPAPPATS